MNIRKVILAGYRLAEPAMLISYRGCDKAFQETTTGSILDC